MLDELGYQGQTKRFDYFTDAVKFLSTVRAPTGETMAADLILYTIPADSFCFQTIEDLKNQIKRPKVLD